MFGDWTTRLDTSAVPPNFEISIQPGWAVLRPNPSTSQQELICSFSGVCASRRDLSAASRTQRALASVAIRFAAPSTGLRSCAADPSSDQVLEAGTPTQQSTEQHTLNRRLQPFWSSPASNHVIRLQMQIKRGGRMTHHHPLEAIIVPCDHMGHFDHTLTAPWKDRSPLAGRNEGMVSGACDAPWSDLSLIVTAELHPNPQSNGDDGSSQLQSPVAQKIFELDVTRASGIRVMSDIDDTVKHTDLLAGVRETFRNVFCLPLQAAEIPGMSQLYRRLRSSGVSSFHYISNSPIELLDPITAFLHLHRFPAPFSLRLQRYRGRKLLASLMESPSERKRNAILELLVAFTDSRFILIGDSGEEDLELYASIACQHPERIVAVLIRDVTSRDMVDMRQALPATLLPASSTLDVDGAKLHSAERDTSDGSVATDVEQLELAQQKLLRQAAIWKYRVAQVNRDMPQSVPCLVFADPVEIEPIAVRILHHAL